MATIINFITIRLTAAMKTYIILFW